MGIIRPLIWVGSARKDLIALPSSVRRELGYGLYLAQIGERHESSRVLRGFGDACVLEVIASQARGTFRAVYTVRFAAAVFVLHAFHKKPKHGIETPKRD